MKTLLVILGLVGGAVLLGVWGGLEGREEARANGKCFDRFGMHEGFWRSVRQELRDPHSMKDVGYAVEPPDAQGLQQAVMTFRATNAFGGYVKQVAVAHVRAATCEIVDWSFAR